VRCTPASQDLLDDLNWWSSTLQGWVEATHKDGFMHFASRLVTPESLASARIVISDASATGYGYWSIDAVGPIAAIASAVAFTADQCALSSTAREALAVQDFMLHHAAAFAGPSRAPAAGTIVGLGAEPVGARPRHAPHGAEFPARHHLADTQKRRVGALIEHRGKNLPAAPPVGGEEALRIGLVSEVVDDADLMTAARKVADKIAANPPHAVRMTKRLLREGQTADLKNILEMSAAMQSLAHATADNDEAITAFLEKRAPEFKGE
jgi:hypothetical protein